MTWSILPILESLSQARHIKWMRARSRSLMPSLSTLKRQVMEVAESSDLEFGPRLMLKAKNAWSWRRLWQLQVRRGSC